MIRYCLIRLASFVFSRIPVQCGYAFAHIVGEITYYVWREKRLIAIENMVQILGRDTDPRAVRKMARRSFHNYCKYLIDFVRFPALSQEDIERSVIFNGWENFDQALQGGKGVVLIGLHMGNWDLAAAALTSRRYPFNVIAETFTPEKLNEFVQGMRQQIGMKVIPMEKSARRVLNALRHNEMLGLLIDRPVEDYGVAVNFFNALTQVPSGAAALALKTGARVVPAGLVRLPDNRFLALVDHYVHFEPSGDIKRDVQALTQHIMDSLEKMVRQYPDQWFMFRRMWSNGSINSIRQESLAGEPSPGN